MGGWRKCLKSGPLTPRRRVAEGEEICTGCGYTFPAIAHQQIMENRLFKLPQQSSSEWDERREEASEFLLISGVSTHARDTIVPLDLINVLIILNHSAFIGDRLDYLIKILINLDATGSIAWVVKCFSCNNRSFK